MTRARPTAQLPMRDGVSASSVALQRGPWSTVLDFLTERLPRISRAEWYERMARGDVFDAQGQPLRPKAPYRWPTTVHYYRELPPEPRVPFEAPVLYQDDDLLVADKPHFLPVMPSGRHLHETLLVRLKRLTGNPDLVPIHRIDLDTAGLVLFSTRVATRGEWFRLFRERQVAKSYLAVASAKPGVMPGARATLTHHLADGEHHMLMRDVPLRDGVPPNARTELECVAVRSDLALYRLDPITGKRHQLRVQMAAWGCPLVNDRIYPALEPELPPGALPDLARPLQLLAQRLSLVHPITKKPLTFESQRQLMWPNVDAGG